MRRLSEIICNRNPVVLPESTPVRLACERMRQEEAGSVLVCDDDGALVGIFTARDAVRRVFGAGKARNVKLKDVMTRGPITMAPESSAIEALRMMWDGGFRHLPLVDRGQILGIVSRNDFASDERLTLDEERQYWEHMR